MRRSTPGSCSSTQRRAVEPGLRQWHPGADQQAEQWPEMAVVAEQHQSVGHRHQNVAADRQWLVSHRHTRGGLRSPVGLSVQLPTRASDEQRQATLLVQSANGVFEPAPGNGTIRNFSSASATNLRHADRRTRQRPLARRTDRLRSMGSAYAFSPFQFTGMYTASATRSSRAPTPRLNIVGATQISASPGWRRSAATTKAMAPRKCGRARSARHSRPLRRHAVARRCRQLCGGEAP